MRVVRKTNLSALCLELLVRSNTYSIPKAGCRGEYAVGEGILQAELSYSKSMPCLIDRSASPFHADDVMTHG